MDRRLDVAGAVAMMVIGAVFIVYAQFILSVTVRIEDPLGLEGMPTLMGAFLIVMGLWIGGRHVLAMKRGEGVMAAPDGKTDLADHPSSFLRVVVIWWWVAVFVFLIQYLGYLLAAAVGTAVLLRIMGMTKPTQIGVISVIYAIVSWLAFDVLLDVGLPSGLLPF